MTIKDNEIPEGWIVYLLRLIIRVINTMFVFSRYTLWGYQLPKRPDAKQVLAWHQQHGFFHQHLMIESLFSWLNTTIAAMYIPSQGLFVFVSEIETIKHILTDKELFPTRGPTGFDAWVKLGLLGLPTGPVWKVHRTLVSTALNTHSLKIYSSTISRVTETLTQLWTEPAPDGTPYHDVQADLGRCTLDIIASVAFGLKLGLVMDRDARFNKAADLILKETMLLSTQPLFLKWFPLGRQTRFQKELSFVRSFVLVKGAMNSQQHKVDTDSVLGRLREAQYTHGISDEEVIQEVLTIGGAGHETTGNTLSWCLMLLAENPAEQAKLFAEVEKKVDGAVPNFEEARKLDRCRAVIYETLRLFPTVPLFARLSSRDCKLQGYDIPAGTKLVINQRVLNRNPEYFPDPERFNPDRFMNHSDPKPPLPVGAPNGPEFAFLPFGAGPRTCIGQRLAILEGTQILGAVIKKFRVVMPPGIRENVEEHCSITLRPRNLRLQFIPRTKAWK